MVERTAIIRNSHGIHCRPSALIVKEVADYDGALEVVAPSGSADLRSMIGLIGLGLAPNTEITLRVSGVDEAAMCDRLVELFECHFDFPERTESAP
jgi:phosphotransferase system HPr (HPr) family protein